MLNSSFLDIIRTFDKDEIKRFEAFLASPYFNTKNNVIQLFTYIRKYGPDFDNKLLDKEELWKKLFSGKEYNYGVMKNVIYDITKLAERFLENENFNSDTNQRTVNLLEKLTEKNLGNLFNSKYNSYEKNSLDSSKFYYTIYKDIWTLKNRKFYAEALNPKIRTKLFSSGIAKITILDFLASFSFIYNSIYIERAEYNEFPETEFISKFSDAIFSDTELEKYIEELSKGNDKDIKLALIFFKQMKCYLNFDKIENYLELKKALTENDKYISEAALRGLYACLGSALDICTDYNNIDKNKELFEIFSKLIEKNIFTSEKGEVVPTLYMMAVKTSGYIKNPEFIEKLMKQFLPGIASDLKENLYLYSMTYLHYSKNEFDLALNYLNKINIDTFQMKYILRNLEVIISYEKNDPIAFTYLKDTHKHFLSKNKSVSERYKESNMKFLSYVNSLFKLREKFNITEKEFVLKDLMKDNVVNKIWLIEKFKEVT
ncbi:MAG: hypothetical protein WAT71_12460 [Ignavibacteria bacterium]